MTETQTVHDKRAEQLALLGLGLHLVAFGVLVAISLTSESHLLMGLARFVLAGVPIWTVLYFVFRQMRRVSSEALDAAELVNARESGGSQTIFEMEDEALYLEQHRLRWLVSWFLPGCTILVASWLLIGHFFWWGWEPSSVFDAEVFLRTENPALWMWFVVGVGLVFHFFAQYALALARLPRWGPLRAGAVFAAGNARGCLVVFIALMAGPNIEWAEPVAAYILRVVLLLLGIELAVNFILDLYRPRVPGQVPRPSFDSRLLGMISEPGGLAKSIADAMNYQFGFQVSSTWFYQLMQRWLFPIVVFTFIVVLALTSVVIVDADEQAVVERFGQVRGGNDAVLEPGIHFKRPFPIDLVRRAPVKQIGELVIGEAPEKEEEDGHHHEAVVWTEKHEDVVEMMLMVASPQLAASIRERDARGESPSTTGGTESVAVSLLMVSVPIEYRIKDISKYLYGYSDPGKLMEVVAYQFLSEYASSVDVDSMLGPGRDEFNRTVRGMIQRRLDELDVGIEIVFVGLRGAHPPESANVAAAFQNVIAAQTGTVALRHAAEGEASRLLTSVAGSVSRARALDEALQARDALAPDSPDLAAAKKRVDDLLFGNQAEGLSPISGGAAARLADARARASQRVSRAATMAHVFGTQSAAFSAAPELYKQRKSLEVYGGGLDNVRKYLIVGDASKVIIELETSKGAGLDEVLSEGVKKERGTQGGS